MRLDQIKAYIASGVFAVEPNFMTELLATLNDGDIQAVAKTDETIAKSHSIEKIGSLAVIKIDATTTKTNNFVNALCGGFVGYDTIKSYIKDAEDDTRIKTILFSIDTRGGDVSGVESLEKAISSSSKHTVTHYENIGASAGIWYGTASKEVFATETTILGSIGVIAGYRDNTGDSSTIKIVSKDAKNKDCSLNGDCAEKIQTRINTYGDMFLEAVAKNTGIEKDTLISHFNYGDVIFAKEALQIGFIDGIATLDELIAKYTTPTVTTVNSTGGNGANTTVGEHMQKAEVTEPTIEALQAGIEAKDEEMATLTASQADSLVQEILAIGAKYDASYETLAEMMKAEDVKDAAIIALEADRAKVGATATAGATTEPTKVEDESGEDEAFFTDEEIQAMREDV